MIRSILGHSFSVSSPPIDKCGLVHRRRGVSALTRIALADSAAKVAGFAALGDTHPAVRREVLRATILLPALSPAELTAIKDLERDPDADR